MITQQDIVYIANWHMEKEGLGVDDFCELIGISRSTFWRISKHSAKLSLSTAVKVLEVCRYRVVYYALQSN